MSVDYNALCGAAEQGVQADEARVVLERGMVVGRHLGCALIVHGPQGARASQLIAGVRQTQGEGASA